LTSASNGPCRAAQVGSVLVSPPIAELGPYRFIQLLTLPQASQNLERSKQSRLVSVCRVIWPEATQLSRLETWPGPRRQECQTLRFFSRPEACHLLQRRHTGTWCIAEEPGSNTYTHWVRRFPRTTRKAEWEERCRAREGGAEE
jgi:hypothetical protein